MNLFFLFLLFTTAHCRRLLHQPFFPLPDSPPFTTTTQPPSHLPQPHPHPKYPFSSQAPPRLPHHHHPPPFFPSSSPPPSPPTSTTSSLPTFPANISSILLPHPPSSHKQQLLLPISLTLSLLSLAFISAVVASLLYRRKTPPSLDSLRLFPPHTPTSSHHHQHLKSSLNSTNASTIPYQRLGSPDLQPLPPLPRHNFPHDHHQASPTHTMSTASELPDPTLHFPGNVPTKLPPPPPPMPPPGFGVQEPPIISPPTQNEETLKPKLKPLHWDKVKASSDRAMVWDRFKFSSFQLNEEMIESLFMVNSSNLKPKDSTNQRMFVPTATMMNQENRVLDPKKSQNIAILLRALNVTVDEVCECLLQGNGDTLGTELLENLLKMAPTQEEEVRLKEFNGESPFKLGPAEKFLKAVVNIPFAFKRVDALLYISNFDSEVDYLERSFETLESACEELRNSRMFIKLLEAVLKTGNRMNVGTNRGDAHAFKLDTLLKLIDVKGTDGKTTLLHFVVQEIIRAEGSRLRGADDNPTAEISQQSALCDDVEFRKLGLQVVSSLSGELSSVKKAAGMDASMLTKEVGRLATGVTKIGEVVILNDQLGLNMRFSDSMTMFLKKAEESIIKIQSQEREAIANVKEITRYFHGNSAKEEAHPLRIFMVVRDFLSVLDQVCKEVGKVNERTIVSNGARHFSLQMNQGLPSIFPRFDGRQQFGTSDGED